MTAPDFQPPAAAGSVSRSAVRRAAGLVLVGSAGVQSSAALSKGLFAAASPPVVSALRIAIGAAIFLVVARPRLTGRSRREWTGIVVFGAALVAMNVALYEAVARIPLGVAITLEFLGPAAVAVAGSRHWRELAAALAALGGVALIAGPGGTFDTTGYAFGIAAACFFGLYTALAPRIGSAADDLSALALATTVGALLAAPIVVLSDVQLSESQLFIVAVSALIGVVVPYAVDTIAGRITSARVIGTLFAIDPVMAALIGWLALGQRLPAAAIAGMLLVSAAGAIVVWAADSDNS